MSTDLTTYPKYREIAVELPSKNQFQSLCGRCSCHYHQSCEELEHHEELGSHRIR